MTIPKEMIAGLLTIAVMVLVNMIMLAVAWGRLGQALSDLKDRVSNIERPIGLVTGETTFMRRTECPLMDGTMRKDLADVVARLTVLEREVRELVLQGSERDRRGT